jgi:ABC-2 type transport system permease protein
MSSTPKISRTSNLRAYWRVFAVSAREDRANPSRIGGSIFIGVTRMIMLSAIYKAAYAVTGGSGFSCANAMWSIGLYFAIVFGLGLRNIFRLIDNDIKSGAVEAGLIKPLDWRLTKVCTLLGRSLLEAFLLMVAFAVSLAILVGLPDVGHITLGFAVGYLVLLVLALVASGALFTTVGLSAFWLNDALPVQRIVEKVILVFGGAFVPIALLPDAVQSIVRYSPFGMYAASTQLFNPGLVQTLLPTVISAIIWTILTVLFCGWVWKCAERRMEVNGG